MVYDITPPNLNNLTFSSSPDNPHPDREVMTIKLNERHATEEVGSPEGGTVPRNVLIETVFEMNYSNGLWRKLQLKRTVTS